MNRELFINDFFSKLHQARIGSIFEEYNNNNSNNSNNNNNNNNNNNIYPGNPLALAVFSRALQMCVYSNKQVSSVSVSLRFVGRFPKRTLSYKNLFYKINVM